MHSSCNLIKSSNTSVKGDIKIVTECVVTEEEQHFQEIENNQIKSYEVIGASILDKARKDSDHIIMEAFQYSKNIEKEAYEKGYAQGVNNGYEDGNKQGYAESKEEAKSIIEDAVKKAREILLSAEKQVEDYKIKKEKEIVKLSLEMAKIITNKNFENDESVISLINPVLEQFRGEENIVIKCNGNYIVAIESKVNEWKKSYAISGEILVLEDPLMELGNAVLEKSTGKVVVGLDVSLEKLEESIKEFCGEEDA